MQKKHKGLQDIQQEDVLIFFVMYIICNVRIIATFITKFKHCTKTTSHAMRCHCLPESRNADDLPVKIDIKTLR